MGVGLASGNIVDTLSANAIATGCKRYILFTTLAQVGGGHFNPAGTLAFALRGAPSLGMRYNSSSCR